MKKLFIISILFCLFVINYNLFAQTMSAVEREEYLFRLSIVDEDSMYTDNYFSTAVQELWWWTFNDRKQEFDEAIPLLVEHIWDAPSSSDQLDVIFLLNQFSAVETERLALEFIDSVEVSTNLGVESSRNQLKVEATEILFELGNYSTYQYAFIQMESEQPEISAQLITILSKIIKHFPNEEEKAKNYLMEIAVNDSIDNIFRYYAVSDLTELYDGDEMVPFFAERFKYEKEFATSSLIIQYLFKFKDEKIEEAFRYKLNTPEWDALAYPYGDDWETGLKQLVNKYGGTYNYHLLLEKSKSEPQWDYHVTFFKLSRVKPILPDSTTTIATMLDTLTSYTNQCYGYEWLKDEAYKNELLNKLTNAKTKLSSGDSTDCRTEVAAFQNSVNQVYQDSAGSYPKYVSEEGYKFLYYYAGYILDRLPEPPTVEGLPVNLKDSQGNLLQGGSLKYFDAGWHK